ncbi:MAG: hypothetical protein O7D30_03025 [Rickettsia endosymbiont of Ixodes persulcatus]|nr:hypothetical protein [Rickettsia endosymbiont of Ixodes persulcatus]
MLFPTIWEISHDSATLGETRKGQLWRLYFCLFFIRTLFIWLLPEVEINLQLIDSAVVCLAFSFFLSCDAILNQGAKEALITPRARRDAFEELRLFPVVLRFGKTLHVFSMVIFIVYTRF